VKAVPDGGCCEAFHASLREFVAREIAPYANDWDEA